jgi:hypothetical protein
MTWDQSQNPKPRKWGPIDQPYDRKTAFRHKKWCENHGVTVDYPTYLRLVAEYHKARIKYRPHRVWGPIDRPDEWTREKAQLHYKYCLRYGKMSWDDYKAGRKYTGKVRFRGDPPELKPDPKPATQTGKDLISHDNPRRSVFLRDIPDIIRKINRKDQNAAIKPKESLIPQDRPRDSVFRRDPADIIRKINRKAMGI